MTDDDMLIKMSSIIDRYNKFLTHIRYTEGRRADPVWQTNNGDRCYGFVPTPHPVYLMRVLNMALQFVKRSIKESRPTSFLDAGCGMGNVMVEAYEVGFDKVVGIELDPITAAYARRMLDCFTHTEFEIIEGDIRKYTKYGEHDVIYYYQPLYGRLGMDPFLNILKETASVGSVIIVNGSDTFYDDYRFRNILDANESYSSIPVDAVYVKEVK